MRLHPVSINLGMALSLFHFYLTSTISGVSCFNLVSYYTIHSITVHGNRVEPDIPTQLLPAIYKLGRAAVKGVLENISFTV